MAVLYVAEFRDKARPDVQIPRAAPLAEQTVAIGGASVQCTNAFNAATRLIRVHTDAICSIAWGTNPTATTSTMRLAANQTEYFGVPPGESYKVAVISNT